MKQMLSVEQSAELIKRGVKRNKASGTYVGRWEHSSEGSFPDPESVEPLFTLADLLSLLPVDIYYEHKTYELAMRFIIEKWHVEYSFNFDDILEIKPANEFIDALYEMVLWCLDNNHVKLD